MKVEVDIDKLYEIMDELSSIWNKLSCLSDVDE